MIESVKDYLYDRRRGLTKVVGVFGAAYLVGRYVSERLEEVKEKVMQERLARDSLRRRFVQNQEDISYTIMALLPTLGEQILEKLNVESITRELQSKSRTSQVASMEPLPPPQSESSTSSSIELLQDQDTRSDVESISMSSFSGQDEVTGAASSHLTESQSLIVDQFTTELSHQPSTASEPPLSNSKFPDPFTGAQLSDSITTASSALSYEDGTRLVPPDNRNSELSGTSTRSKAELWEEVKMLTFTRTLTILYSMTLLTLFTNIQLTLLARSKYVQSILQQERDERLREGLSVYSLLWGAIGGNNIFDLEDLGEGSGEGDEQEISEQVEVKYLTLSWWILHVGWKDIAERVRRGVEEVFEGVGLKTRLGAVELHRLVEDVRRRVEHEVTFEGTERRINFLSSLLPPTTETMQHVLTQGGITPYLAAHHDPTFTSLLSETRSLLQSSDFERVLERSLDRAVEILFDGLQKNVFVDPDISVGGVGVGLSGEDSVRLRLAGLLPGLARWSHLALNGLPNELVDNLTDVREVAAFSAIMFSAFEDRYR